MLASWPAQVPPAEGRGAGAGRNLGTVLAAVSHSAAQHTTRQHTALHHTHIIMVLALALKAELNGYIPLER